jgi:hypothetical protein
VPDSDARSLGNSDDVTHAVGRSARQSRDSPTTQQAISRVDEPGWRLVRKRERKNSSKLVCLLQMNRECPRPELNQRTRFRKPLLYPLSYGGVRLNSPCALCAGCFGHCNRGRAQSAVPARRANRGLACPDRASVACSSPSRVSRVTSLGGFQALSCPGGSLAALCLSTGRGPVDGPRTSLNGGTRTSRLNGVQAHEGDT